MARIPATLLPVGDVKLGYHEFGAGYPVILINGLASPMDTWNPPVLETISRHFRVITFDNRGTGYSGVSDKPFSVSLFARDTAALMDALCISRAHVLGFSMGACIAQEIALQFPEKIDRLVLVSGDCGGSEAVRMGSGILARLTDKSGTMQEVAGRMFPLLFPADWLATHDPFQYCPDVYETTDEKNCARQAAAFSSWPGSFSRLGNIQSPTLILTGDEDVVVPPQNAVILSSQIPGAKLVTFYGGGHGVMYQFPDRFSRTVLAFLER